MHDDPHRRGGRSITELHPAAADLDPRLRPPTEPDFDVAGDVAVWFGELDQPQSEGQHRVPALDPEAVWLAHEREPWRPPVSSH